MAKAPASYLNRRRPPMEEAMRREGNVSFMEAIESLKKKGYFTPPPRPWKLGRKDRGHDHSNWAVLDKFGDFVVETSNRTIAEFIIAAANAMRV